jgi:hypothetical protein
MVARKPVVKPVDEPVVLAKFTAYQKGARFAERDGEMILTLGVPLEDKYLALPLTDKPGVMFDITVTHKPYVGLGGESHG